ncbi:MAG: shikimate kinase [Nitrosopumilus sp. H13]|nr:MAG: shikimate kinase [Nitrosopumilus sp. H13]
MMRCISIVHGAVSLVNAIATRRGATLGIGLEVRATVEAGPGSGVIIEQTGLSSRLIRSTVLRVVPKRKLLRNKISISVESEIPAGYGLKSSSAISSAVALVCSRAFRPGFTDRQVLLAGVEASIESKVSITGAYDDACSCYFGGFNVTDNEKRRRVAHSRAPPGLGAVIFIPRNRKRGRVKDLGRTPRVFEKAWELARNKKYWEAMNINGFATASVLNSDPTLIARLIGAGALGASVSGNGPAVAAVAKKADIPGIKKAFSSLEGRVIVSNVSNRGPKVWSAG